MRLESQAESVSTTDPLFLHACTHALMHACACVHVRTRTHTHTRTHHPALSISFSSPGEEAPGCNIGRKWSTQI